MAEFYQVTNHFYPGHLELKRQQYFQCTNRVIFNKSGPFLLQFH